MKIETKYDKKQQVYLGHEKTTIKEIVITIDSNGQRIKYYTTDSSDSVNEDELKSEQEYKEHLLQLVKDLGTE